MFNTPTVFVLGAGASWHYGYPTGEELVRRTVATARELAGLFREWYMERVPLGLAFVQRRDERRSGTGRDFLPQAEEEALELASRLETANPTLIDYFLKQNKDLQDIGRFAIALVLFECEWEHAGAGANPNRIALHQRLVRQGLASSAEIDPKAFNDDWLRFVLFKLTSGCERSADLHRNKVDFVTFNYDVSLERRLHDGLSSIELFAQADVDRFIEAGRIHHVYGKLREKLAWNPGRVSLTGVSAAHGMDTALRIMRYLDMAYRASQGIRTIDGPDKDADAETLERARKAIADAQKVFILGYAFDQSNNRRIGLDVLRHRLELGRSVFFTNFGGHNRVSMAASRTMLGTSEMFLPPKPPVRAFDFGARFRFEMSTKNVYDALNEDFESLETD